MSLIDEYKRQFKFRDWDSAIEFCPALKDLRILDLGCGTGELAKKLVHKGSTCKVYCTVGVRESAKILTKQNNPT